MTGRTDVDPRGLEWWTAVVTCVGIGAFWPIAGPFSTAFVIPIALLPVWARDAVRTELRWLVWVAPIALLNGLILTQVMSAGARSVSPSLALAQGTLLVTVVLGAGALLWARRTLGSGVMAAVFGLGVLVGQLRVGLSDDNPWKYNLFIPALLSVLGITLARRATRTEAVALMVLALLSVVADSRSAASIVALAFLTLVWHQVRRRLPGRVGRGQVLLTLAFVGVTLYLLMQSFILEGYFGSSTQQRSQEQMQATGSLLLGGRPEIGATIALLRAAPWGYGMGIIPDGHDVWVAKGGMAALNYDPNNGYVERYMFGDGMEVHSGLGDLWLHHGWAGLAFGIVALAIVGHRLLAQLAQNQASALLVVLAVFTFWDALFSPFHTASTRILIVALALAVREPPSRLASTGEGGVTAHGNSSG